MTGLRSNGQRVQTSDGNEVKYWFNLDDTYYVSLSDTTYDLSHSVLLANWYYDELSARDVSTVTVSAIRSNRENLFSFRLMVDHKNCL